MTHRALTTNRTLITACLALIIAQSAMAAQKQIRFIDTTTLAGLGLELKLMPHSTSAPLPSPKTYYYTLTQGDKTWKEEFLDPIEVWFQSQHAGRWSDRDGNTLTLATISRYQPTGFSKTHVSRAEYNRVISLPENQPPTAWQIPDLSRWVCEFVGVQEARASAIRTPSLNLHHTLRFQLPGQPPTRLAYVIRARSYRRTSREDENPWIYLQIDLHPEAHIATATSAIESSLIKSIRRIDITHSNASQSSNSSMQNRNHSGGTSDAFNRSRETVIRSVANMQEWWYAETQNYIVLSDLSSRHRPMAKALQEQVETLRRAYQQLIPPIVPITAVAVIRIPSDTAAYISYVGAGNEWTGGMWQPTIRELIIRPIDSGTTREQRQRLLKVAFHEAFHQYLFYALDTRQTPPWFNEGHAVLFENATIAPSSVKLTENAENVTRILNMISERRLNIRALLATDYAAFYDADPERRADNYALAWAIIYYMRKGAIQEHPARHHQICDTFTKALVVDAPTATQKAFKTINMDQFEKQFVDFWTSKHRRTQANYMRVK